MKLLLFFYEMLLLLSLLAADGVQHLLSIVEATPLLCAAADNAAHGLIALCSWNVVSLPQRFIVSELYPSILCALLACVIDIDHFLFSKSWSLADAVRLKRRPPFHATIPLITLSGVVCFFRRYYHLHEDVLKSGLGWSTLFGPIALVAVTSHHVRDALRRGIWLWPLFATKHTPSMPYPLVYALTLLFPIFVARFIYSPSGSSLTLSTIQDV